GECTAGGVIGGDDEEVSARGYLALLTIGECFSDLLRRRGAYLAYAGEVFCLKSRDVGADHADGFLRIEWISSVVGIAVEHSCREATIAPATFAKRSVSSRPQPRKSPRVNAPPKPSPAPRPFTTSTKWGGTTTVSSAVLASTPSGPCLTMAICTPRSRRACVVGCQNTGRSSRSRIVLVLRPRAFTAVKCDPREGSSDSPVTVKQNTRLDLTASRSRCLSSIFRSGALGKR